MFKLFHVLLAVISVASLIVRIILSEKNSPLMADKRMVIIPHALNGLLLLSGFILLFQGGWLSGNYGWVVAKLIAIAGYIVLSLVAMKNRGQLRWQAFGGAMACIVYIFAVAATKSVFIFF